MSNLTAISEARDARNRITNLAREVLDRTETEGREPTADEEAQVNRALDAVAQLTSELNGLEKSRVTDDKVDTQRDEWDNRVRPNMGNPSYSGGEASTISQQIVEMARGERKGVEIDVTAYANRRNQERLMNPGRNGYEERTLTTAETSNNAGHTIDDDFVTSLYDYMEIYSGVRNTNPRVITTMSGEDINWPRSKAHGTAGVYAEGATISGTDPTFDTFTLKAYKFGQLLQVSSELISDTSIDLLGWLAMDLGRSIARLTDNKYVNGTGTVEPAGLVGIGTAILGNGATGTTGVAGKPGFDDLYDLKYSVDEAYRGSAAIFFMNDATNAPIAKLKDADNRYLWQPSHQMGAPDMLVGHRIVTDPHMPVTAVSARSIVFGDFSCFVIRDVGTIRLERSDDYAFHTDLATYRILTRTDSNVIDGRGLKSFVGGAS